MRGKAKVVSNITNNETKMVENQGEESSYQRVNAYTARKAYRAIKNKFKKCMNARVTAIPNAGTLNRN